MSDTLPDAIRLRLGRKVYEFGEADSMEEGDEGHGPWEDAPAAFQSFCMRMAEHIIAEWRRIELERFDVKEGDDFAYPIPTGRPSKDMN